MNSSVLKDPRPIGQSAFLIPTLSGGIPQTLSNQCKQQQVLARFALAADHVGIPLPGGEFDSIDKVLGRQWLQFFTSLNADAVEDVLVGRPSFIVTDEEFEVRIEACSNLNVITLKPVVEKLESFHKGLGWFVMDVITSANSHDFRMYDIAFLADDADGSCEGEETDQGYARLLLSNEGVDVDYDAEVADDVIARLREENQAFPSDYLKQVGGHAHLLNWRDSKKPKKLTVTAVGKLLKSVELTPDMAACVRDALVLQKSFRKNCRRPFIWDTITEFDDEEEEHRDRYEPEELIGALCWVAWEDPKWLFEIASHFEQRAYEVGSGIEAIAHCRIPVNAPDTQFEQLAKDLRAYLEQWNLLNNLLAHFPINEDFRDEL